jgi:hypothetical protein
MWNPLQTHLHSPSEHTVEGQQFEAEMHMVHVAAKTATDEERAKAPLAAIGIIFDSRPGKYDPSTKDDAKLAAAADTFF